MRALTLLLISITFLTACSDKQTLKSTEQSNIFFKKAYKNWQEGKTQSSYYNFNLAKEMFLKQNDSLNVGASLVCMAIITTDLGDHLGGQALSVDAISYFNENKVAHHDYIHRNYNNLGIASYRLKEYTNAIKFYDLAIKFTHDSLKDKSLYLNNKAKVYEELRRFDEALLIYSEVLEGLPSDRIEYARVSTNISFTKWRQNTNYRPLPELLKSLSIRIKENDILGQNHSYARLADYYTSKNPDSALIYAERMHRVAQELNSPDDRLEALEKLVKLSQGLQSKQYFESFRELEDSVQFERNKSKNQFAIIRYETEKHKANNLILQKDNTEKKYQLIKQKGLLVGGLTFAFFAVVVSFILYRKRKQKMMLASQNAIRENQLKTSKQVHDVVANGLYRVMAEIENSEQLNREHVLDKLEDMYEKSRDLSYEELHFNDQNFHEKIADLLRSFATETTKVVFVGNTEELWKKVNAQSKYEIEHILQELLVNMKKHSMASNVAIRFEQKDAHIYVYYADNGIGMQKGQEFKNGLTNTGNRIVSINGQITFDTEAEKGLKIQVSFPVS